MTWSRAYAFPPIRESLLDSRSCLTAPLQSALKRSDCPTDKLKSALPHQSCPVSKNGEQTHVCIPSETPARMLGGPAQDLRNFQMVPILILSVLTYSTSSPHDILKVSDFFLTITCLLGGSNATMVFRVGIVIGFWWVFDLV